MVVEINAVMQSFRALTNLVKANKSLTNFNELSAAVSEVNAQLMNAQAAVLDSQKEQLTLTKRVGELEKEIIELKDWNREAERYELSEIGSRVFAYALKPGMENNEPAHHLCANCFTKKEKSILQLHGYTSGLLSVCPRCKERFPTSSVKLSR